MNTEMHSGTAWQTAFGVAEESSWDETDARELGYLNYLPNGGELAAVLAGLYTEDVVGQDEGRLWAAIQVACTERPEFDQEFLLRVLGSHMRESVDNLEDIAISFINKRWPDFPVCTVSDLPAFARTHAFDDHEAGAPDQPGGGTLHYFDRTKW
ncbi:hypothetical protein ACFQ61_08045 [Streptomyces sp. NPDC056500]|uniref:hypothetical protein n=1 Tax=Streptomyces sp. NPDC056500 TaxID=3345840 RepID=UPI00369F8145